MRKRLTAAQMHFERADKLAWNHHRMDDALREYRAALELDPKMARAHWRIGQTYFHEQKQDFAAALAAFQETVRLAPEWNEGYYWCALALQCLDRLEEALTAFYDAIRLEPDDTRAHIALGKCYYKMRRFDLAIQHIADGIRLRPVYGEMAARLMLGDAYAANGQFAEAITEWHEVAAMRPAWPYEYDNAIHALRMLAQHGLL